MRRKKRRKYETHTINHINNFEYLLIVALAFVVVLFVAYQPYLDSSEIELRRLLCCV